MRRVLFLFIFLFSLFSFGQGNQFANPYLMEDGTIRTCSGIFYDSGGFVGDYSNDENITMTICPDEENSFIRVDFIMFLLENNEDLLFVYDGDSTDAPLYSPAGYSGNNDGLVLQASSDNTSGCLTFVFQSNGVNTAPGWMANISCVKACQEITAQFVSSVPAIDRTIEAVCEEDLGVIRVCAGELVTFTGDAIFSDSGSNAKYIWNFDNGTTGEGKTASTTFEEIGAYKVSLVVEDENKCISRNLVRVVVQVSENNPEIDITSDQENYCIGDNIELTAVAIIAPFEYVPESPVAGETFLPDGQGEIYTTSIEMKNYCDDQIFGDANDIRVCINMEHSALIDLEIRLVAPNGATVALHDRNGWTDNASFPKGLGLPNYFENNKEEDEALGSGEGWTYCFTMSADSLLHNGSTTPNNVRGNSINAGDYLPKESFEGFVGTPLNGNWTLEIEDREMNDNGWIFWWSIELADHLAPADLSFTPEIREQKWLDAPGLTDLGNGRAVVNASTSGNKTFTYQITDNFGCVYTEDIEILVEGKPLIEKPRNLFACKGDNDSADFTLSDVESSMSSATNYVYTYYNSEEEALEGSDSSLDLTQTVALGDSPKEIWVRVNIEDTVCFSVDSFLLNVRDCNLNINDLNDLYVCGENTPFDLTQQTPLVYNNTPGYTVSYYTSEADANAAQNAISIGNAGSYIAADETTIFVRVEDDNDPTSFEITSFRLFIRNNPVIPQIGDLYACPINANKNLGLFDLSVNNSRLTLNIADLEVTYYRTEVEADEKDANGLLPNDYTTETSTIWARVENLITGCYSLVELNLVVEALPELNEEVVTYYCDTNNDGIGEFSFDTISPLVLNGSVTPEIDVEYYISQANAENSVSPLSSPFINTTPFAQTIYAKVFYIGTNCSKIVPVELIVNPKVNVATPTPISVCVDNVSRVVTVDLTSKETEILNGLTASDYVISYYTQENNALNAINAIQNPREYSNTISRNVWVRVESISSGCFSVVALDIVNVLEPQLPIYIPEYVICDGEENDGYGIFELESYIGNIVGSQLGLEISFYSNYEDAASTENALPNTYQNTVPFLQDVYIRVEDENTGCFVIRHMNLKVVALPVLNIPSSPITVCNSSENGIGNFNLVQLVEELQNGIQGLEIYFYETESNANEDVNRIPNPQSYNNLNNIIWVRAFSPLTNCYVVKPLTLNVVAAPITPLEVDDLVACASEDDLNFYVFDLTVQTPSIIASQNQTTNPIGQLNVTYYLSEEDAQLGQNSIPNASTYRNGSNPQTIWFRVANSATTCFATGSFNLLVNDPLVLTNPDELILCQAVLPNTGEMSFDLTQNEPQILGGRELFGITFSYYLSKSDAEQDVNAISSPSTYRNVENPQTVWVAVTNANGCRSFVSMTLKVIPLPEVNMNPRPLVSCEVDNVNGGAEFNLTLRESDIGNGDDGLTYEYYRTEAEAITGTDPVAFPERFFSNDNQVWVRVSNSLNDSSCYVLVPIELRIIPQPVIPVLTPLLACEVETDGFFTFNLADKYSEILNGRNPENYLIRFYKERRLAEEGAIAAMNLTYTNEEENQEVIWVRLEVLDGGCYYIAPLTLKVEEQVFAFEIEDPAPYCDDNDALDNIANDGRTVIDLTVFSAAIIGEQNIGADSLRVDYYASERDFINNNLIGNPRQFVNTTSPQTIIAVVRNTSEGMLCQAEIRFEIIVNKRPEVIEDLEGGYICTDFETGDVTSVLIDSKLDSSLYEFIWTRNGVVIPEATLSYYEATQAGTYTVSTVSIETGCASFNSATVVIDAIVPFTVKIEEEEGNRDVISENGTQTIVVNIAENAVPSGTYEFALDDGEYRDSNIFYGVEPGDHIIWVRDKETGACAVSTVATVMNYPKYFTPNGDGYHDTWNIIGLKAQPNAKIFIFDRFGKLIKQISPVGEGWDGTFGGRPMPSTDYWFTVEYNDFKGNRREFKGHFSLKR